MSYARHSKQRVACRRWLYAWLLMTALAMVGCQPLVQPAPASLSSDQARPATPSVTPAILMPELPSVAEAWVLTDCQSCHGALAEGDVAPALRGTALDAAAFLAAVREGRQGMRPYSVAELPDDRVGQMHAWLRALPPAAPTPLPNVYGLTAPPGVAVSRVAADVERPAGLVFGPDGALYVAAHGPAAGAGQVWRLADADSDGLAGERMLIADGLSRPTALLWLSPPAAQPTLLIGGQNSLSIWSPGQATPRSLALNLPGVTTFMINDLALGVDGFVYLAQGPLWPAAADAAAQPGAIWRSPVEALLTPDTPITAELFAFGMRTPFGLAFSPSGAIYSIDSSMGWPPAPAAPDELNLLLGGGDYGWSADPGQATAARGAIGPMVEFPIGVGASDVLFYSGRQFAEHANDLIVAYSGQPGAPAPASGPTSPRLVRVEIVSDAAGYHSYIHEFISGLQRPLGLAEDPAGALYVSDYDAGVIYRFHR